MRCHFGSHPAALRQLVFRFAELTEREDEVASINRDTIESDLKQTRELVGGGSVEHVNQPVVEAALRGRLLVHEGIEKAERIPSSTTCSRIARWLLRMGAF